MCMKIELHRIGAEIKLKHQINIFTHFIFYLSSSCPIIMSSVSLWLSSQGTDQTISTGKSLETDKTDQLINISCKIFFNVFTGC